MSQKPLNLLSRNNKWEVENLFNNNKRFWFLLIFQNSNKNKSHLMLVASLFRCFLIFHPFTINDDVCSCGDNNKQKRNEWKKLTQIFVHRTAFCQEEVMSNEGALNVAFHAFRVTIDSLWVVKFMGDLNASARLLYDSEICKNKIYLRIYLLLCHFSFKVVGNTSDHT